jgi:hypothetical protein
VIDSWHALITLNLSCCTNCVYALRDMDFNTDRTCYKDARAHIFSALYNNCMMYAGQHIVHMRGYNWQHKQFMQPTQEHCTSRWLYSSLQLRLL